MISLFLTMVAHSVSANNPNLKFMMFYDFNISAQHDMITSVSGDGASPEDMARICLPEVSFFLNAQHVFIRAGQGI